MGPKCLRPKYSGPKCEWPKCTGPKCVFAPNVWGPNECLAQMLVGPKCVGPKCEWPKYSWPKCVGAKCDLGPNVSQPSELLYQNRSLVYHKDAGLCHIYITISTITSVRPCVRPVSVRHKKFFSLKSPWNHPLTHHAAPPEELARTRRALSSKSQK